jgi:hypothetical protein
MALCNVRYKGQLMALDGMHALHLLSVGGTWVPQHAMVGLVSFAQPTPSSGFEYFYKPGHQQHARIVDIEAWHAL